MIIEGVDGVTHVNIYSKAKTELGRWLSNFAYAPIRITGHGRFASIEAYWYWLKDNVPTSSACSRSTLFRLHRMFGGEYAT